MIAPNTNTNALDNQGSSLVVAPVRADPVDIVLNTLDRVYDGLGDASDVFASLGLRADLREGPYGESRVPVSRRLRSENQPPNRNGGKFHSSPSVKRPRQYFEQLEPR
jgi:hypothetical protein